MALTEDKTVYFDPNVFGTTATVAGSSVDGIKGSGWVDEGGVGRRVTTFMCLTSDTESVSDGDPVTLESASYTVAGPPQRNGDITTLNLVKA